MNAFGSRFHCFCRIRLQIIFRDHKTVKRFDGCQFPGDGCCRPALQLQFRNVADNLGTLHICQLVFRNGKRLAEDPQIPLIGNPGIVRKAKLYLQIFHK